MQFVEMQSLEPQSSPPQSPDDQVQPTEVEAAPLRAIVGIGGSAGALDAYEHFFLGLPAGSHMAFVVVPHQDPNYRGVMPELLQRCTELPVTEIEEGLELRADRVYVAPPGHDVSVVNGVLHLTPRQFRRPDSATLPIDHFFESLALDQATLAVAVVLSGMGHDGSRGVQAVREAGGLVMVQEPATAEYPSMPESAIQTLSAHHVLPADELAARLQNFVLRRAGLRRQTHPHDLLQEEINTGGDGLPSPMLQNILLMIRSMVGHDFTGYKQSTLMRRINRRMQSQGLSNLGQYARYVRETPGEVTSLYKDLTINVTSFFRDPDAYVSLADQLRHYLVAHAAEQVSFRVWAPGCSTGEEAYSLAIVLHEVLAKLGETHNIQVQIFATDIDEDSVAVARAGLYSSRISYMVSPERLQRYFLPRDDGYQIKPEIRDMVVFALHNTFGDPPFTRLDLLCCRNMLIYLGSDLQRQLIPLFYYTLKPGGLLFLGPSETVGSSRDLFPALDSQWKLFRRSPGLAQPLNLSYGTHPLRLDPITRTEAVQPHRGPREAELSQMVNSVLLSDYTPPSVVVTPKGDIVHVVGRTGPYLELARGKVGTNVLEMAKDGLRYELSTLLRQVNAEQREVSVRSLRTLVDGEYRAVDLLVRPLNLPRMEQQLLLVVFELVPENKDTQTLAAAQLASPMPSAAREDGEADPDDARPAAPDQLAESQATIIREMERELKYSREYLQANMEEMEVSLEQLKTTNEELQTTNEELQSTNEELMTSKEELQSLNEELITINTEHQLIISDLAQANDDMKNLLDSAGIATVFLGNDLRIKRFTPKITGVINLIPSDAGRPITHIVTNLRYDGLEHDILEVLRTLAPHEAEVQTHDGQWFLMKVAPYRTFDNFIDGVVIVFTSITVIKRLEQQLQVSTLYADEAINAFPDPFLVLDTELRLLSANRAFYRMMRLTPQQADGQSLMGLGGGEKDFRGIEELLQRVARGQDRVTDHAAEFDVPFVGRRTMKFTSRHLTGKDTQTQLVLLTMEDVTDLLKEAEALGAAGVLEQAEPADESRESPDGPARS